MPKLLGIRRASIRKENVYKIDVKVLRFAMHMNNANTSFFVSIEGQIARMI